MKVEGGRELVWIIALTLGLAAPLVAEPPIATPPDPTPVPMPAPTPSPTEAAAPVRVFQDWTLECAQACFIEIIVRSSEPEAPPLLGLTLRPTAIDAWEMIIATSLPLYLPDGLILTPSQSDPRPLPWFTCASGGCEARIPLDPDLLGALRRQREASVELTLVDGARARLPVSLLGFAAALRALAVSRDP